MNKFDCVPLEGVDGDGADCLGPGCVPNECCCNAKHSEHVFP